MWEDGGAAVGEEGVLKGDGWIQVLPDEKITVIECCRADFKKQFMRFGNGSRHMIDSEGVIIVRGRNSDGSRHSEGVSVNDFCCEKLEMRNYLCFHQMNLRRQGG